jgi:hypothetical protein
MCRERNPELPEDWELFCFECIPHYGKTTHIEVTGSVSRRLKRGPRKGFKVWKPKTSEETFVFTPSEVESFRAIPGNVYGVAVKYLGELLGEGLDPTIAIEQCYRGFDLSPTDVQRLKFGIGLAQT